MKRPKCNEDIVDLINVISGNERYFLDNEGEYLRIDFVPNNSTNDFCCPRCDKTLFTDETKAIEFLNTK